MTSYELLDNFVQHIKWNPCKKQIEKSARKYFFYKAETCISTLLDYEPTGILAVSYAKQMLIERIEQQQQEAISAFLMHQVEKEELENSLVLSKKFNDSEVRQKEKEFLDKFNAMVETAMGKPLLGERNESMEQYLLGQSIIRAAEALNECCVEVFQKGGPIGKIEKIVTRILAYEEMAECLLDLEYGPDALYLCYINQYRQRSGYFSYFIKNNGNLISISNRTSQAYMQPPSSMFNYQWSINRADKIFPYDMIEQYLDGDNKSSVTMHQMQQLKLNFEDFPPLASFPVLLAMFLFKNHFEGQAIEGEELYLNTLMPENLIEKTAEEQKIIKNSILAARHAVFMKQLVSGHFISGALNEQERIKSISTLWIDLYGDGFKPSFNNLLPSTGKRSERDEARFYREFIGTKEEMEREAYRTIRQQLANHIKAGMEKEYEAFGGTEAVLSYWSEHVKIYKEKFLDAICQYTYRKVHLDERTESQIDEISAKTVLEDYGVEITPLWKRIEKETELPFGHCMNKNVIYGEYGEDDIINALDDYTRGKCTVFYSLNFFNWLEMEDFLTEKLPKIFQGYHESQRYYKMNGNPYDTDPIEAVSSILCGDFDHDECYFTIWMGFTQSGWKRLYTDWLKKNHLEKKEKI